MSLRVVIVMAVLLLLEVATADVKSQIKQISPQMPHAKVVKLASHIEAACIEFNIPCELYTAILAQESMFQLDAFNVKTQDYGIAQINIKTIKAYKFDKHLLLTDLRYSVRAGAKVLSWFTRYKSKESNWACRYNVGTGSLRDKKLKKCLKYSSLVNRYKYKTLLAQGE